MPRMLTRLMIFFLFVTIAPHAQGEEWERTHIGDYASEQNEPLHDFIKRLGRVLYQHTKATGHEACGVIGSNPLGHFGVSLYSDGVQRGCTMRFKDVPDGFLSTGETIHSHPLARQIRLTGRDIEWNRAHGQVMQGQIVLIKPGFSKNDLQLGPGWLIDGMDIHYYNGTSMRGRRMGVISPPETAPNALPVDRNQAERAEDQ